MLDAGEPRAALLPHGPHAAEAGPGNGRAVIRVVAGDDHGPLRLTLDLPVEPGRADDGGPTRANGVEPLHRTAVIVLMMAADELLRQSVDILQRLYRDAPDRIEYRQQLGWSHVVWSSKYLHGHDVRFWQSR